MTNQLANGIEASDSSKSSVGDDRDLLGLGSQLDDLIAQLLAAQSNDELVACPDQLSASFGNSSGDGTEGASVSEAQTKRVEVLLARLYPIERAIMAAPAYSIVGLTVKARHAAYVMSQYWEEPTEKIDWEAQAIRSLIEAVCKVARMPLSFRTRVR